MYFVCYLGTSGVIVVKAKCQTVEEIDAIYEEAKSNQHRSALQSADLFVLTVMVR